MYFANPWGLLGLLTLPVIIYVHMFHRRFPPLEVAGLHLWTLDTRKDTPGRKKEQLPITRSLLLELLAALLISLLLADPRDASVTTRPHLVVVLDNSASMSARLPETGESTRDRAIQWLNEQQKIMGRDSVYSILTTGQRPTLIAGPRTSWEEVTSAITNWQPSSPRHSFDTTWDLGSQLAGKEAVFVFLTDKLPREEHFTPERMSVHSFGRKLDNVAITAARWLYDPQSGEGTIFIRIANLGEADVNTNVTGMAKDKKIVSESISLESGIEKSMQWKVPGGLSEIILSATTPGDPLDIDNEITLIEPHARTVTVAVILPSSHTAFENVKRILGVMPDIQLGDVAQANLVIAPATDTPKNKRGLWWLGIGPVNPSPQSTKAAKSVIGPFLIEKQHSLMDGIVLGGVVWGGVQKNPAATIPVISTAKSILLGQRSGTAANSYILNIDLAVSNLTESPDWPIFWTNLIEQCRTSQPGFQRWNYHLEEPIQFSLAPDSINKDRELTLTHNQQKKPLLRMATVEIPPRDAIGIYTVQDGKELLGKFAVNFFDREESNLLTLKPGKKPPSVPKPALGIHLDNPFSWLLIIGLLLTIIAIVSDWYFLQTKKSAM